MEITELQEDFPLLTTDSSRSTDKIHVTEIIADIEKTLGKEYKGDWDSQITREIGFLWEGVLSRAFGDSLAIRPPEVEVDGIVMSMDGVDLDNWTIEEYKCTWSSTKKSPDMVWRWMSQTKAYCKGMGKQKKEGGKYPCVKFHILYLMGGYDGKGPKYKVYRVEFSELEIEENWAMIVNHARHRGRIE